MNRIAEWVVSNWRLAWTLLVTLSALAGISVGQYWHDAAKRDFLARLELEGEHLRIELSSQTLHGRAAGANGLSGIVEDMIKQDAEGTQPPNSPRMLRYLENLAGVQGARGMLIIGANGIVRSSWDDSGKTSTGLDVGYRSYFKVAMQGKHSIYAAVSMTTNTRSIYSATPIYLGETSHSPIMGAIASRTGLESIDELLNKRADAALLVTPQNMVFASYPTKWFGSLAGDATPELLDNIRSKRQFGNMLDGKRPASLPYPVQPGISEFNGKSYAVARTAVNWNDPLGDWNVLLISDLDQHIRPETYLGPEIGSAVVIALLGGLILFWLRGQHIRDQARSELERLAVKSAESARRKAQLADAALVLQQQESTQALGNSFLSQVHQLLGSLQGCIYLFDEKGNDLHLLAAYACDAGIEPRLAKGTGLLGQCALDGQSRVIATPDTAYWKITSSLGDSRPDNVIITPIQFNDRRLGVVEIALLGRLSPEAHEHFSEMVALLAFNLQILGRFHTNGRLPEEQTA